MTTLASCTFCGGAASLALCPAGAVLCLLPQDSGKPGTDEEDFIDGAGMPRGDKYSWPN